MQNLENEILTPHIGGSTQEAQSRISEEVAHKLLKYSESIFYQVKDLYQLDDKMTYPISAHKIFKSMNIM